MRQLAYFGVAALSAVALVGIGCSSDDNNTGGTGGETSALGGSSASGGSNSTSGGKSSSSTTSVTTGGTTSTTTSVGGVTSAGGATSGTTGGSTGAATGGAATGGAPTAGGTTGTAVTSTGGSSMIAGDNIVNDTCQVTSTEGAMGIVGGFYVYGDQNAEHPNGQSCTLPPQGANVCEPEGGGICLSGATIKDSTYSAWGCGIGLSLNSTGSGDADAGETEDAGTATDKSPYSGPATCFQFTFTGTTGGLYLRVGYTQYADTSILSQSVAPYKSVGFTNGWTGKVCFEDVICPNWPTAPGQGCPADMVATPSSSYDIQITVPGGSEAADYDFCLTSVIPLKPQTP
jgi:hypothetical protein